MGSARRSPELKETKNDYEDKKKPVYQQWEKIWDFHLDVQKTAAKISRMCADTLQKEFLAVKISTEWDPKELWDWLKRRYTLQSFASRCSALHEIPGIQDSECKNVTEYMNRIKDASVKSDNLKIRISEIVLFTLSTISNHNFNRT